MHQLNLLQTLIYLHQLLKLQELQPVPQAPRTPRVHSATPAPRVPGSLHVLQQLLYLHELLKLHQRLEYHQQLNLDEHIRILQLLELYEQSPSFSMATNPKFLNFISSRNRPRAPRALYEVHEEQINGNTYLVKKRLT